VGLLGVITNRSFWFVFVWLLPLGLPGLGGLPKPWVRASLCAALGALLLGAYHGSEGNVARAMFNAAGPVLSLAAAISLKRLAARLS
jgi:hypothetical protein